MKLPTPILVFVVICVTRINKYLFKNIKKAIWSNLAHVAFCLDNYDIVQPIPEFALLLHTFLNKSSDDFRGWPW